MALPAQVTFGTVTGKLLSAIADSADAGTSPDGVPLQGQVTFSPQIGKSLHNGSLAGGGRLLVASATPPVTVVAKSVPVLLDVNGAFSVDLIATDNPDISPTGWTWEVSFALTGVTIPKFSFAMPAGESVDLAVVAPLDVSTGSALFINEAAASAAAAEASAVSAAASASLVGAPADVAVAALLGNPASATSTELSSTYALKGDSGAVLPRLASKVATGQAVKVTFIGDSGLEGATTTTPGTDDTASLFCTDLAARFGVAVTKSNRAVSGQCAYWHLMTSVLSPTRFAGALTDAADLYVISFGHNDIRSDLSNPGTGYPLAASMGAIEHMIRRIRLAVPGADILISDEWPYTSTSIGSNTYLVPHSKALSRLAAHYGCAFVSFTAALTALGVTGANAAVDDLYIVPTGQTFAQHPNSGGARVWADTMLALIPLGARPSATPPATIPPGLFAPERYGLWAQYVNLAGGVRPYGQDGYHLAGAWSSVAAQPSTNSTANDYMQAQFIGTEASIRLDTGAGQGTVKINIDAVDVYPSLDLSTYSTGQSRIPFTALAPGYHRILVTILSGSVTFRGLEVLTLPATKIKWDSPRIVYTGTWTEPANDATRYYGTSKNTVVVNDSFTVDFVGTALALAGMRYTTGCTYGVTIDGVAQPDALATGATASAASGLVLVSGLPYGRHTAVITAKALSGGRALNVSGLIVYDETRTDRPTRLRGVAKVGETVTLATALPGVPAVRLSAADSASLVPPYPTAVTASGLTVNGTATALVEWEAESARAAW